ncbi:hypothetical protein [Winogradskyella sp.]|jgi:predicted porin|uniref:hypothetical protein n=1 Tax=Winogradskyella sp. TaxID=1883156 RepID=UPI0025D28584|nr:hypothetical protein [Winogradskyella sp.]MCT4630960.1 porin family protein [Winogradskyella sp.]
MNLNLIIKVLLGLVFCLQLQAQNAKNSLNRGEVPSKFKFLYDESRQYIGSISFSYQMPTSYGDNFIGDAYKGKDGFGFDANLFVFKNLYIGLNYGIKNFDIIDNQSVGNYNNTQIEERYITIGYEFLPVSKIRLGIYTSVIGKATLSNDLNRDSGNFWCYGLRLEYEFIKNLNIMVAYNWRQVKTDIRVPRELQSYFEKGTFNVLSFGVKFTFGKYDFVDAIVL